MYLADVPKCVCVKMHVNKVSYLYMPAFVHPPTLPFYTEILLTLKEIERIYIHTVTRHRVDVQLKENIFKTYLF